MSIKPLCQVQIMHLGELLLASSVHRCFAFEDHRGGTGFLFFFNIISSSYSYEKLYVRVTPMHSIVHTQTDRQTITWIMHTLTITWTYISIYRRTDRQTDRDRHDTCMQTNTYILTDMHRYTDTTIIHT